MSFDACDELGDELEQLVDHQGLCAVLDLVADIAYGKAEHIEEHWQDPALARKWQRAGELIGKLASKMQGMNL
jgi:hypothetical protein